MRQGFLVLLLVRFGVLGVIGQGTRVARHYNSPGERQQREDFSAQDSIRPPPDFRAKTDDFFMEV